MDIINKLIVKNKERQLNIVVLGDTIIDQYQNGSVTRISPEFPVQILKSKLNDEQFCPGGSANVCFQFSHFNVQSSLIGFIDDLAESIYEKYSFDIQSCVRLKKGYVPRKVRFYDTDFPLLRWDIEEPMYGEEDLRELQERALINLINIPKIDAVILSDYNKGFWDNSLAKKVIDYCNINKIPTIVDPKKNLSLWKNCTIFKPNNHEAEDITGKKHWKDQVDYLQKELRCQGIVITQEGRGVVGKYEDRYFEHWTENGISSKEVNSVIGAGDCFNAIMSIGLSHKLSFEDSCRLAFEGGVQYVKAKHNKPITIQDIHARFDSLSAKIISLDDLLYLKNKVFKEDKFVFTNGCFDVLHRGHVSTLKFAKSKGDKLVVGLNSDSSVKALKGDARPLKTWEERSQLISALECVDFVVGFDDSTPERLIRHILPHCLVKGGDYTKEQVVGHNVVKEVHIVPIIPGYSTTEFVKGLK